MGTALKAPAWALSLNPFHALAAVPQEDLALIPAGILILVGLAPMAVSLSAFRQRDLVTG